MPEEQKHAHRSVRLSSGAVNASSRFPQTSQVADANGKAAAVEMLHERERVLARCAERVAELRHGGLALALEQRSHRRLRAFVLRSPVEIVSDAPKRAEHEQAFERLPHRHALAGDRALDFRKRIRREIGFIFRRKRYPEERGLLAIQLRLDAR